MKLFQWKWYYGWNIVFAASFISLVTAGMRMSVGPFFLPMLNDFEMSRTGLSLIVGIGMFVYGLGMPLAGFMESRIGPRYVLLLGAVIVFGSCLWMVFTNTATGLMLSFGILLSLGLSLTSQITLTPIIVRWFIRRRGQALFYLSTGTMAGIAILNPVFNTLIEMFSWQHTIMFYGVGFILIVVPVALFILREDVPKGADQPVTKNASELKSLEPVQTSVAQQGSLSVKDAIKTLPFWQICIGLFACGYSMNLIGSHGVPMLVDHGFSSTVAATAIGFIGLVAIPGTIILGSLADRIPRKNLLALIYITRGIGFIFIVWVISAFQLYLVAFIAGLAWAGNVALSSAILSDVYGVRLVGILYGMAFFVHQIGATISTLFGGWGYDAFHTHWVSFGSAGVLLFIAAFISLKIRLNVKKEIMENKQVAEV